MNNQFICCLIKVPNGEFCEGCDRLNRDDYCEIFNTKLERKERDGMYEPKKCTQCLQAVVNPIKVEGEKI